MDLALISAFAVLCAGQGALLWLALVRPHQLGAIWGRDELGDRPFFEERPALLGALRVALALGLLVTAFLTGAGTAFLGLTR